MSINQMTESILITERQELTNSPTHIQKIISVSYRPEFEYFYDYLDLDRYEETYYAIDEAVNQFVSQCKKGKVLFYRDISIIQIFRLTLFLYLLNAELLRRTFRQLAEKYPKTRFEIEKNEFNGETAYLDPIISVTAPDLLPRISIIDRNDHSIRLAKPSLKQKIKTVIWPPKVDHWVAQDPKVLIYSDYYRSSSVMKKLKGRNSVYYTCFPEPKIFFESLRHQFSYVQNVSLPNESQNTQNLLSNEILEALKAAIDQSFDDFPELRGVTKGCLAYLFENQLPAIFYQIDRAYELFEKRPSIESVLLDEDMSHFKNAFCQVAQRFNKTCFVEAHGSLGDKYGYLPLTADYMFVWGKPQKEKLIGWGGSQDRFIISGCSKYQTYKSKNNQSSRNEFCKRYHLDPNIPIVSLFPFPTMNRCYFYNKLIRSRVELILNSLKSEPIQLVIKLHPGECNKEFYYSWPKSNGIESKTLVIQRMDPLSLVKASDLLIAHDSTMAMDGFALEKPVIFFPLFPKSAYSNDCVSEFMDYEIFHRPKDTQEFLSIFKSLLKNQKMNFKESDLKQVRKDCLNEDGPLPEEIISSYLLREKEVFHHVKNA